MAKLYDWRNWGNARPHLQYSGTPLTEQHPEQHLSEGTQPVVAVSLEEETVVVVEQVPAAAVAAEMVAVDDMMQE
jgi:hypothetical protein